MGLFPAAIGLKESAHKLSPKVAVSCNGEVFLMYSRSVLVLMLSLVTGLLQSSQNAPAQGESDDVRSTIAGVWRGYSEGAVKNSPCHDEVNRYRFSKIAGRANAVSVTASKVVDGKEVVMGSGEWKYDEKKKVVETEKPSIQM